MTSFKVIQVELQYLLQILTEESIIVSRHLEISYAETEEYDHCTFKLLIDKQGLVGLSKQIQHHHCTTEEGTIQM